MDPLPFVQIPAKVMNDSKTTAEGSTPTPLLRRFESTASYAPDFDNGLRHEDSICDDPYLGPKLSRNRQRLQAIRQCRLAREKLELAVSKEEQPSTCVRILERPRPKIVRDLPLMEAGCHSPRPAGTNHPSFPAQPWAQFLEKSSCASTQFDTGKTISFSSSSDSSHVLQDANSGYSLGNESSNGKVSLLDPVTPMATESEPLSSLFQAPENNTPERIVPEPPDSGTQCRLWQSVCQTLSERSYSPTELSEAYMNLGHAFRNNQRFRKSAQAYAKACTVFKGMGFEMGALTAIQYQALAFANLRINGVPKRSASFMRQILELRIQRQGLRHMDTIDCLYQLGVCLRLASERFDAHDCFLQAYFLSVSLLGKFHEHVASVAWALGGCCAEIGHIEDALYYLRTSLQIFEIADRNQTNSKAEQEQLRAQMKCLTQLQRGTQHQHRLERIEL